MQAWATAGSEPVVQTAVLTRDGSGRIMSAVENGVTVTRTPATCRVLRYRLLNERTEDRVQRRFIEDVSCGLRMEDPRQASDWYR